MLDYLVYRIGMNKANQPMTERSPIAVVNAASPKEACEAVVTYGDHLLMHTGDLRVFPNQRLEAIPCSQAPDGDWQRLGYTV